MFRRQHSHSAPIGSSVKRVVTPPVVQAERNYARPTGIPKQWHAISVEAKPLSCIEAHNLRKQRFLSKEAPKLPLRGCTKGAICPCTYKHHDDRRAKARRKESASVSNSKTPASERRRSRGRRSDD